MRSTSKGLILKLSIIVFAAIVCLAATAMQAWQGRGLKAENPPTAAGGTSFIPASTPALW